MDPAAVDRFRTRLVQLADELRGEGDVDLTSTQRDGGDGKVDDDAAPFSEMNQVIASSRNRERTLRLREISAALKRLDEAPEDYGLCEECDEEIVARRLELMPWARLCIDCQGKRESDAPGRRRHVTDYR